MRSQIIILVFIFSLALPIAAHTVEPEISARLLVSNPAPYLGEEIDLQLEVTYLGHPGSRTRFNWPQLDNFVAADLLTIRSQRRRDVKNRLVETITRRIRPLLSGTILLAEATVLTGNKRIELQPLTLRVQPLPTTDKPDNFNNYVGDYRFSLAATGSGPREINLHIYDSNQLEAVPSVVEWPDSGAQLILIDTTTRVAGAKGREHILRYFYSPAADKQGALRFSLPFFAPQSQSYIEIKTGPLEQSASALLIIFSLFGSVLFAAGLTLFMRKRHPRTVDECLQRFCRRSVTGLSREKIQELLQPYFSHDEVAALRCYWQHEDALRFNHSQPAAEPNARPVAKSLRKSLCKAIDKQQNIT